MQMHIFHGLLLLWGFFPSGVDSCDAEDAKGCEEEQSRIIGSTLVLFTDSYDAVVSGAPADIVRRFISMGVSIFMWPLASSGSMRNACAACVMLA